MGVNDFVTLFFLVAAVLIFLQLRNVLGRRTGNEKPRFDPYAVNERTAQTKSEEAVVTLPRGEGNGEELNPYVLADEFAKPGTELNAGIRKLIDADPSFNPKEFMKGAGMAYEMIVMAFADGDRATLRNLLSPDVYEGFEQAIKEREERGEVVKSNFVGIEKADMMTAGIEDAQANVTVRIISQLISATYDRDGKLVEGDAEEVAEVRDIWTFARDVRSRDPNWKLVSTASEH
ncbi:Tim44/TimA family putative adaptor protein [Rhizobium sp. L1K21]|uniref:Tim44/TimA family putative adaptor protein n=1 Tax=Rhizobium sp. L1K21 TaxID=2954933 RepID=UPI002093699C|nr:Tim44/TimA family putative adaptor protein [Rhizobium sp. L1K21]MCO6187998.1 Tim44/TimA family putative adaptor protein [Rhizobium sp. L1K21]